MPRIIVDSTCDMPKEWRESYGILTLPLVVEVEGREYLDGEDIQLGQLYEFMREGVYPKTSQVPVERMYKLFTRCLEAGEDILYLAFSAKLSGTYQIAELMLGELRPAFPERKMTVVDSKAGSLGTGLMARRAAELAKQGEDFNNILTALEHIIERVELIFTISSLKWLVKGGRIGKPAGYVGDVLDIKPLLDVEDGKMVVMGALRGRKKALRLLADEVAKRAAAWPDQLIAIVHADDQETAELLEEAIRERLPLARTLICPIGCVLAAHLGIGGVGAMFFREE